MSILVVSCAPRGRLSKDYELYALPMSLQNFHRTLIDFANVYNCDELEIKFVEDLVEAVEYKKRPMSPDLIINVARVHLFPDSLIEVCNKGEIYISTVETILEFQLPFTSNIVVVSANKNYVEVIAENSLYYTNGASISKDVLRSLKFDSFGSLVNAYKNAVDQVCKYTGFVR